MIEVQKCFSGEQVLTVDDWKFAGPELKGWLVYMFGARKNQPNIPTGWRPPEHQLDAYKSGGDTAALETRGCL